MKEKSKNIWLTNFLLLILFFFSNYIEGKTGLDLVILPDVPTFETQNLPSENGLANFKVRWIPNVAGAKAGSHFFVKHREKGGTWEDSEPELDDDTIVVRGLDPDLQYEFKVVAVDGGHMTESESKFISSDGIGKFLKILILYSII